MRNQKFTSHTRRIWERFRDDSVIVVVNRADPPISCPRSRRTRRGVNGECGRRIIGDSRFAVLAQNEYIFIRARLLLKRARRNDGNYVKSMRSRGSRCSTVSKAPSITPRKLYGGKIYDFKIIPGGSANRISNVELSDTILFNNDISTCISDVSKIYDRGPLGIPPLTFS